ncbi:hypothetical protein K2173_027043 [Erythroxylum novogranatense]|uniref:Uncharacterized protein n=1 Tax=Erythroxylum novogranatense TaxID=1862640 RepID=A0AAV8TXX4_9ROSI|nr:hypothetical protein K2173_027043 [Erythroxylum novogranatense]
MDVALVRNRSNGSKTVVLIWCICVCFYFLILQMAFKNSSSHNHPAASSSSDPSVSNGEQRSILYDKMEKDLEEHGARFLQHGETSQSLLLSELFTVKDGSLRPVLKEAKPPVRANVLYLNPEYSIPIAEAVKHVFKSYFDKAIWFQNSSLYHFSMFHASHHILPVPATVEEVEAEATAVKAVAEGICPLKIVLDRVVLTSTGVLMGCWQVISGTDPISIRVKLRAALPHAPEKQLYDAAILHTSFARLLGSPKAASMEQSNQLQFFQELVSRLNDKIRGFEAFVSELWYVEEYDVLALALDGRLNVRRFQLGCNRA